MKGLQDAATALGSTFYEGLCKTSDAILRRYARGTTGVFAHEAEKARCFAEYLVRRGRFAMRGVHVTMAQLNGKQNLAHGKGGGMEEGVKTCFKNTGFCNFTWGSNAAEVDVKDGKILRIRPLRFDKAYERADLNPWRIEARGTVFRCV